MSDWKNIKTAPLDGTWIRVRRESGLVVTESWRDVSHIIRSGKQWVSDTYRYVDVPFDRVVEWQGLED